MPSSLSLLLFFALHFYPDMFYRLSKSDPHIRIVCHYITHLIRTCVYPHSFFFKEVTS